MSWRIVEKLTDRSGTTSPVAGSVGAMVIRAEKGTPYPTKIAERNTQRLLDIFGLPSPTNPDVIEAIKYNEIAPIWVSTSVNAADRMGGVMVSATEVTSFTSGQGVTYTTLSEIQTSLFDLTTKLFVILHKTPRKNNDVRVKVTYNKSKDTFTVEIQKLELSTWIDEETVEFSLIPNAKDGYNASIYYEDVLRDNDFIQVVVNEDIYTDYEASKDTFTVASPAWVTLTDAAKADASDNEIVLAWDYYKQARKYAADIFMDPTGFAGVAAAFDVLRTSYHKYSYFICALPQAATVADVLDVETPARPAVFNMGLAFYWNWGKVINPFGTNYWSSLIGRVGAKFAQMEDAYNGLAPAWIDENNHGGMLGGGIQEMAFDPEESELKALDAAGVNPIIMDPDSGVMIVGQRSGQSTANLSDTSWIAHVRLFDYIRKNIRNQVLTYQICKLNDDDHRQLAFTKANSILRPIISFKLLTDKSRVVCDASNNREGVELAQRKFRLTLILQVTPFSEEVVFDLIYVGPSGNVEEITY